MRDRTPHLNRKTPSDPAGGGDTSGGASGDTSGGASGGGLPSPLLRAVAGRVLVSEADRQRFARSQRQAGAAGVRDYEFTTDFARCRPDLAFDRLRWGGQLVFASHQPREVDELLSYYRGKPEWRIEHEPGLASGAGMPRALSGGALSGGALPGAGAGVVVTPVMPMLGRLPRWAMPGSTRRLVERRGYFMIVRKVLLDPLSRLSARHSYDVSLIRMEGPPDPRDAPDGWVVRKRVPSVEQAMSRLVQTCPNVATSRLAEIAAKLVRKVFPVFLTREAAFLKLLQRDLPASMRGRTPRVMSMETDERGLVRSMTLSWLRLGGEPMPQLTFARQLADLVRALHEAVGVLHLDLRLDNLVVSETGVGLVDFGSSIRVGEHTAANPMIDTLLREMLQASQITADLGRQRSKGMVCSTLFDGLPYPPTAAFDLFALVTNMTRPHDNPDLKGLVTYDRESREAIRLSRLRRAVLRPAREASDDGRAVVDVHGLCEALGVETDRPAARTNRSSGRQGSMPQVLAGPSMPARGRAAPRIERTG